MQKPAILWALLLVTSVWATSSGGQESGGLASLRDRALQLVNESREANGRPPLTQGDNLNEAALAHAQDMLRRNYYAHVSPEGNTVQDRFVKAGGSKWNLVAENIARCAHCISAPSEADVERLHAGWMQSPGHRENILRRGLARFGYAIISDRQDGLYAVQTFAGPGEPRELRAGETPEELSEAQHGTVALQAVNALRKQEGRAPLQLSPVLTDVGQTLLPSPDIEELQNREIDLYGALPPDRRRTWGRLSAQMAACGACGAAPTGADIRGFVEQWTRHNEASSPAASPQFTDMGFAMAANGEGRKVAILVLGTRQ